MDRERDEGGGRRTSDDGIVEFELLGDVSGRSEEGGRVPDSEAEIVGGGVGKAKA